MNTGAIVWGRKLIERKFWGKLKINQIGIGKYWQKQFSLQTEMCEKRPF
jgi:hypothetical protein